MTVSVNPTVIDFGASGQWRLVVVPDLIHHSYGTASSLVVVGDDNYWAAWSDRVGLVDDPNEVHASMGTSNP